MEVKGEFNAQRFFETLARIISQRENVSVTVKVSRETDTDEAEGQETA